MEYLENLDVDYWEQELKNTLHPRKIPITVGKNHFIILLNRQELSELKSLLGEPAKTKFLKPQEIAYTMIDN